MQMMCCYYEKHFQAHSAHVRDIQQEKNVHGGMSNVTVLVYCLGIQLYGWMYQYIYIHTLPILGTDKIILLYS